MTLAACRRRPQIADAKERAPPHLARHPALGLECGERVANHRPGDAELSRQLAFRGELRPGARCTGGGSLELGVVIGRGGRYIPAEEAFAAVAGFVVCMDGTAREWQRAATQWTAGKNFDGTMPIGPELVTPDEVDVSDAQLTTMLNGEVMQSARTSQMIFDVPRTIEFLSSFTTLRPGDVIATGTPGGVGFARQPPIWLKAGDTLEIAVEGIGRIATRVVAEQRDGREEWPWHPPVKTGATF